MPTSSSSSWIADAIGVATIVLVVVVCVAGLWCAGYVLYFLWQVRQQHLLALRAFNSAWGLRLLLIAFSLLWAFTQLLRLPLLRRRHHHLLLLLLPPTFHHASLCRFFIISSSGFLEPCFFLTALLLIHSSLRDDPRCPWTAKASSLLLLLSCLPVLALHIFFLRTSAPQLPPSSSVYAHQHHPLYCCYPLFSTLVLGLFSCLYNACLLCQGWKMVATVINRRLQTRIYALVLALGTLLPVHVVLMGFSVLFTPGGPLFEFMAFLGFVTVLLCMSVAQGILVVQPIADALAVRCCFKSLPVRSPDMNGDPFAINPDTVAIPLSVFGTENDLQSSFRENVE